MVASEGSESDQVGSSSIWEAAAVKMGRPADVPA
jgi:hypothetical protein